MSSATTRPTVSDSTLAAVEVALHACKLSDAEATAVADADMQASSDDHAHARADVAQDTQVFRDAREKAQDAEKARDRRAAWGCWDAHYGRFSETMRAFLVEQRIANDERDHRWVAEQEQRDAERAAEQEKWDAKLAAMRARNKAQIDDLSKLNDAFTRRNDTLERGIDALVKDDIRWRADFAKMEDRVAAMEISCARFESGLKYPGFGEMDSFQEDSDAYARIQDQVAINNAESCVESDSW
ncbi:hypothetical protein HYPSUDRAFT_45739 [Hypholoma sublateritium FD-334 SS-4]|uniref:Uncharacterized protein n=1 Tax=Hypholoma sublateritium (strain FD-334 SS-4) TaxID=945553 RepID=A0A0D2PCL1_HYPSF|nr:hypothetical protein HYPSUDRAFT_45739 [Hypholoma sublateritium FD-334 SS-4]